MAWLLAAVLCWRGIATLEDASAPWVARILLPMLAVLAACWAWSYARAELVVDEENVVIRDARTHTFPWSAVTAVSPSYLGIVFRLNDGRRVAPQATARAGLQLLVPRYDQALLSLLRSCVAGDAA